MNRREFVLASAAVVLSRPAVDDGPKPAGLRYCIDSVSLRFIRF